MHKRGRLHIAGLFCQEQSLNALSTFFTSDRPQLSELKGWVGVTSQILFLKRLLLASFNSFARKRVNHYLTLNLRFEKQTAVINTNTKHQVMINTRNK